MGVGSKIKQRRIELGLSQDELAKKLGYNSRSTINKIEKGINDISQTKLIAFANALNTTPNDLLDIDNKGIKIPILGSVIAGVPIEAIEEILGYEEISQDMVKTGEYFALRIKGESMEPKMSEGDIKKKKKQNTVDSGQIAIVLVNGYEATVKKVRFRDNGIELIAFNSYVYEPHFYNAKEIQELPVQIIGRVVELRAKF